MVSTDRVLVDTIRARLAAEADPVRAPQTQAYMKSEMPYLGVPLPRVRAIVRAEAAERPPATVADLTATVRELWRPAVYREERYAATELTGLSSVRKLQTLELLPLYQEMMSPAPGGITSTGWRTGSARSCWPFLRRCGRPSSPGHVIRTVGSAGRRSSASSTPRTGPTSRCCRRRSWRTPTTPTSSCARPSAGPSASTPESTRTGCAASSPAMNSAHCPGEKRRNTSVDDSGAEPGAVVLGRSGHRRVPRDRRLLDGQRSVGGPEAQCECKGLHTRSQSLRVRVGVEEPSRLEQRAGSGRGWP